MALPKFKYLAPSTIKEACAFLNEFKGRTAIMAGGTDLVMHLKQGLESPAYLLSLKNLHELNSLQVDPDSGYVLGAMCSLRNISLNPRIKSDLGGLARAAEDVASPQIRNRGTIGGNICLDSRCWYYNRSWQWRKTLPPCHKTGGDQCHVVKGGKKCYALFQADTVPSLLVLKAELKLVSLWGERIIPIEAFYSMQGENPNRLSPGEILTQILIPRLPSLAGMVYVKYRKRGALDFPVLGLSCLVRLDNGGKNCREVRFAFVGHGSGPLMVDASDLLKGLEVPKLSEDQVTQLVGKLKLTNHMGVSASLKRRLARVLLRRAFRDAWGVALGRDTYQ